MGAAVSRADAAAATVGAADVFVLRRVKDEKFVHFGGTGRGAGWAGLIEVSSEESDALGRCLAERAPVRLANAGKVLVFGPYYARAAAFVPVTNDVVVVFGGEDAALDSAGDDALRTAATIAADAVEHVTPAKRLADELEELEAVRAALAVPTDDVVEAMRSLATCAAEALSCEVAAMYVADRARLEIVERGWSIGASRDAVASALKGVLDDSRFPYCVQDASVVPLPTPLDDTPGIRSYYLLELQGVARGVLFLAHTDAAPRGFTLLCRRLGIRLAEVVAAQAGLAITREWCREEADRLHAEFGRLDAS